MILIDTHVHIHKSTNVELLLQSAHDNFFKQAKISGDGRFDGVLICCSLPRFDFFSRLEKKLRKTKTDHAGDWLLQLDENRTCITATTGQDKRLFLLKGQQLNSSEGIEILSLFTTRPIEQTYSLAQTIKLIAEHEGIAIVPWGFGKWLGKRGKIVTQVFADTNKTMLFAGDNGGRPFFLFSKAFSRHKRQFEHSSDTILSGSDPLPLRNEEKRVGNFGVISPKKTLNPHENIPGQIRTILCNTSQTRHHYGTPLSPYHFLLNQIKIRIQ